MSASASERLREMERRWSLMDGSYSANAARDVMAALPELAALVEAAEKIADPKDYWDWVTGYAPECKEALARLAQALGEPRG